MCNGNAINVKVSSKRSTLLLELYSAIEICEQDAMILNSLHIMCLVGRSQVCRAGDVRVCRETSSELPHHVAE